ncbi:glutathione S-transferase family protein [Brevundimonas sp.]|uniref:glutathione S-transferase family protein n=1 Tax=Brevundimonas sp. TaxID=1871086 RepID=UPI002737AE3C|nr:glutathione S-transferase family protein [Brevundimonas sp.]MDP3802746.1 glutathione S-transferase family protein [Brevundimonas sp.]
MSQSDDEIVFYTNPMSRGRIARWMLEEIGRPYRTVVLDYGTTMKAPGYLAINPMGKVPAVTWRGVTVTECAAVCAWLADACPEAGLAPAFDDPARGTYLRWMFFGAGPLEAAVTAKALNLLAPADKAAMAGYGSFDQVVDALEQAVTGSGGPWLLGDRFSALDVYLGSQIGWGLQFKSIPDRDAFKAYAGRLFQREAAVRAREIDDALIAGANATG